MYAHQSAGSAEQRRKKWLSKINGKSVQPRERIEEVKESCNKCPKLEEKAKKLEEAANKYKKEANKYKKEANKLKYKKEANKLEKEVNKQMKEVTVLKKQLQESQQGIFYFYIILFPSTFSFSFFSAEICAFELF